MVANDVPATPEWPQIVQGSSAAAFIGPSEVAFACMSCGHVLVAGYVPRMFAAVDFECWRCHQVNRTPQWPTAEPMPVGLISLGRAGRLRVAETVDVRSKAVVFAPEQEIERIRASTGIGPHVAGSFELSADGLREVEARLSVMFEGFQGELRRARNAVRRGNHRFMQCPPAWSVARLEHSLASGTINLDEDDGAALMYLYALLSVFPRWQHHQRFAAMTKALLSEFHHSITQLILANYLTESGNAIGFEEPKTGGGRSSDLFFNVNAVDRHNIEVKTSADLQWPSTIPTVEAMTRIVEKKLREARGQISAGGMLVVGAAISDPAFPSIARGAIEQMVARSEIPSRVSAIAVVNVPTRPSVWPSGNRVTFEFDASVECVVNPRYAGTGGVMVLQTAAH